MIAIENVNTYVSGTFPNTVAVNSSGPATQDGFEFIAEWINNSVIGNQQDWMDYAGLTPNGVTESAGVSQIRNAVQLGNAIGPGIGVQWWKNDDPSVTGDRVLLLQGQGVLIASYPLLDAACYVGDANNAAVAAGGGKFYRSSDAAGTTPNIAGPYIQLPEARGYTLRGLDQSAVVDPDGASRYLGDNQVDSFQAWQLGVDADDTGAKEYWARSSTRDYLSTEAAQSGFTPLQMQTTAQGVAGKVIPKDDGTNGTPRVSTETRMTNISIKFGITY
jgi:hypothetical protein